MVVSEPSGSVCRLEEFPTLALLTLSSGYVHTSYSQICSYRVKINRAPLVTMVTHGTSRLFPHPVFS